MQISVGLVSLQLLHHFKVIVRQREQQSAVPRVTRPSSQPLLRTAFSEPLTSSAAHSRKSRSERGRTTSLPRTMLFTILLLLITILALLLRYSGRSSRDNEPPLDKGLIPWLGHALEFGKDAAKFLARMKNKHGDIFTVCVAGQYITVLLDPNSYDDVLYDTDSFDSRRSKGLLMEKVFSLVLPSDNPEKERKWMEGHFQGVGLDKLQSSMDSHLRDLLLADQRGCGTAQWREEGLFDLCYGLLFRAGYLTMFTRDENADAVYKQFRNFDKLLPKLARSSLKGEDKKSVTSSQESLWQLLAPALLEGGRDAGCWQESYQRYLGEAGVDAETQRKALLMHLWTTQCNAGPAAFWSLALLLRHPEAMQAVLAEVRGVMHEHSLHHPTHERLVTHNTPVFDSVLRETLRLTAAAFISREVMADGKKLGVSGGLEYCLRKGDKVLLFPFLCPQMDPEIHQQPESFRYKRFLNDDMSEKRIFYKGGSRLKHYNMPWGAERKGCVGKQFAISTVKMFVFTVLRHLELEMCEPSDPLPQFNPQRYGFGMLQPIGDLQVRYRFKRN
ncbi:prostacyclin synthase [Gadus morhua]|uniref:Prostacyclin synthase n=1 Tax=Gadus morhua TaxID=8049 RepID=A0A8C5A7N0_GADMO|nr:prostacyclin synthase-like [Gadus morhua]